jgi:hypothetical protein
MARRRPTSYAWARHARTLGLTGRLTEAGSDGLEYADQLADAAAFRAERALAREVVPPLTIQELAAQFGLSASSVRGRIALAREQMFGDLTDAGIRARVRARRSRLGQQARPCAEPDCTRHLARTAPAHRRYCTEHSTTAARVRRHRAGKRQTSGS